MQRVTINRDDWQSDRGCEQCGSSPTTIAVIRWAHPTEDEPETRPQQTHFFCRIHQAAAYRMWRELLDTAQFLHRPPPSGLC
jgi:hypothetical protein